MNETENTMKSDKKTLLKIKEDNSSLHKLLEKHEKLLQDSEEAQTKNADLQSMK